MTYFRLRIDVYILEFALLAILEDKLAIVINAWQSFFPSYLCGRHSKAIEAHSLKRVFSHLLHADWIQQANQWKVRVKGILCERPCTYKNHSRILHSKTTKAWPLFSVSWNCFVSLWAGINTLNVNATQTWLCDSSYSVKPPFQQAWVRGLLSEA